MKRVQTFLTGAAIAAACLLVADAITAAPRIDPGKVQPKQDPSPRILGIPPIDSRVQVRPDLLAAYCDPSFKKNGAHPYKYVCVFAFRPQCRDGNGKMTAADRPPTLVRVNNKYWTVRYGCRVAPK